MKVIEKTCVICGKKFTTNIFRGSTKATCSSECSYELTRKIAKESEKKRQAIVVVRKCKQCNKEFNGNGLFKTSFCSLNCQYVFRSKSRKGKNNPAYRNGCYVKKNLKKYYSTKHLRACSKYKKEFLEKNDYLYCECCGTSSSARFETHHIYFASRYPKNKELHNSLNLILLCIACHNNFHSGKLNEKLKELEKERGLIDLFKTK